MLLDKLPGRREGGKDGKTGNVTRRQPNVFIFPSYRLTGYQHQVIIVLMRVSFFSFLWAVKNKLL